MFAIDPPAAGSPENEGEAELSAEASAADLMGRLANLLSSMENDDEGFHTITGKQRGPETGAAKREGEGRRKTREDLCMQLRKKRTMKESSMNVRVCTR